MVLGLMVVTNSWISNAEASNYSKMITPGISFDEYSKRCKKHMVLFAKKYPIFIGEENGYKVNRCHRSNTLQVYEICKNNKLVKHVEKPSSIPDPAISSDKFYGIDE